MEGSKVHEALQSVGRFRLLRKVGAGGMGVVYEAEDTRDARRVAVKLLSPHAKNQPDGLLRFKREFRALARFRHPNIVRVFDAGIENDIAFIVMAYIDGISVKRALEAIPLGPLRDQRLKTYLRQILGALAHVHARGIVHRDLKPENMLVDDKGLLTVMDFGVAQFQTTPEAVPGVFGSFGYMAPEQAQGREVDGRADLYAVGMLLYEALTGQPPFPTEPPATALHHHLNTTPPPIDTHRKDADPELAALALKLLQKDPQDRPPSAEAAFQYLSSSARAPRPKEEVGMLFAPRFSGRKAPLLALAKLAEATEAGEGSLLLIEGSSGSGKSRLLSEFKAQARARFELLRGSCPIEQRRPYAVIIQILADMAGRLSRSDPALLDRVLGEEGMILLPLLPGLRARSGTQSARQNAELAEDPVHRLHQATLAVLDRVAEHRPLLLLIEDLHAVDVASRELLSEWVAHTQAQSRRRIGMVWTRRYLIEGEDHSEPLVSRVSQQYPLQRLALAPMTRSEVAEMVQTMTSEPAAPSEMIDALISQAQGQPMLIREMMESWVEDGRLTRKKGRWLYQNTPFAAAKKRPRPSSSQAEAALRVQVSEPLWQAKIGRLKTPAIHLLERFAITGRELSAQLLFDLSGLTEASFLDAVNALLRLNIVVEATGPLGLSYAIHHEGLREGVVHGLSPKRRRKLHRKVAELIEARYRGRRGEVAHLLARHFQGAHCPERAVSYLRRMGRSAAQSGQFESAHHLFQEARSILSALPQSLARHTRKLSLALDEIDALLMAKSAEAALDRARPETAVAARDPVYMEQALMLRRAEAYGLLGEAEEAKRALAGILEQPASPAIEARARAARTGAARAPE